jgi:hypothetical protein
MSGLYRVQVFDEASVVARGEQVRVWFVRQSAAWVRAKDHPGARAMEVDDQRDAGRCPPGTIWRRVVELELPPSTLLRLTISRPLEEHRSPLGYLTRGQVGKRRRVEDQWYRLEGNYRLERVATPPLSERGGEAPSVEPELRRAGLGTPDDS